jgi:hypothetical protein
MRRKDEDKPGAMPSKAVAMRLCASLALFTVSIYWASIFLESHNYYSLPVSKKGDSFNSEAIESARKTLHALSAVGPRIAGTIANDVVARDFLLGAIEKIKQSSSNEFIIDVEVQRPTGYYHLEFLNRFTNAYCNVTNVVVKLTPKSLLQKMGEKKIPSVLVNAHFDSFVLSPGASDDLVGVALMLEVLRLLSLDTDLAKTMQNSVVFLFNGAEESNLQGAHGFISQHRWAQNVRVLVNLEAIGAGGREIVFQCNSPWLIGLYGRSAPFPTSSGIAHELFQLLLWRVAATDWRVIIEHGPAGIVGTDSAYVDNGYAYHSSFDTAGAVPDGTLFNTGSNLLAFIRALVSAPELSLGQPDWLALNNLKSNADGFIYNRFDSHFIFFDVFRLVQISYSGFYVYLINFLVGFGALYLCWHLVPDTTVLKSILSGSFQTIGANCLLCGVLGYLYSIFAPMRWYTGGINYTILVYLPPVLLMEYVMSSKRYLNIKTMPIRNCRDVDGLLHWTALLLITTPLKHKGSYMFMMWALFGSISLCWRLWFNKSRSVADLKRGQLTSGQLLMVEVISALILVPPVLFWLRYMRSTLELFVPMLGKTGTFLNGDVTVGLLMALFLGGFFRLLLVNFRSIKAFDDYMVVNSEATTRNVKRLAAVVILGTFICLALFSSSYSLSRPKRLWIHHLERDLTGLKEGKDSGVWVVGFDGQGMAPLLSDAGRLDGRHYTSSFRGTWLTPRSEGSEPIVTPVDYTHHGKGFNCAIIDGECYIYWPYYFPVAEALRESFYLPAAPPKLVGIEESDKEFSLAVAAKSSTHSAGSTRRISILLTGPTHEMLVIRDRYGGSRVRRWGFIQTTSLAAHPSFREQDIPLQKVPAPRPDGVYYIQIGFGICQGNCAFRMELEVENDEKVEISAYGHYVLARNTPELIDLTAELPGWSVGAEWTYFVSKVIATSA